jgi:beta-N-acetylhexosaminidase
MRCTSAIVGIPGPILDAPTAARLRDGRPAGVILFGRNVRDPAQLRALILALRAVLPSEAVVMVDQEGGRVARLRPPHWRGHPAAGRIGEIWATNPEAATRCAWLTGALIGADCAAMGFDVACAPVLDRRLEGAADVVGDRGFAADPHVVSVLGRALADGLLAAGIMPVIKHLPGHGRARVDSHHDLPVVSDDAPEDLLPFVANADLPWAMTAHIVYPRWDATNPATLSARVIAEVIRGTIGFGGVLVSDDLAMHALSGPPEASALAALAAGCDLAMYCPGDADATNAVLAACKPVSDATLSRLRAARDVVFSARRELDVTALAAERDNFLQ